jgi:3-isopropylmalate dehydrogenase
MLLDHLGMTGEAARIEAAVADDLASRGSARRRTAEVGDALVARVSEPGAVTGPRTR